MTMPNTSEIVGDRIELDTLMGLQNKHSYLTRSQRQLDDIKGSIKAISNYGSNGVPAITAATPSTTDGSEVSDAGIENRRTVINYYPQAATPTPSPTPSPTPTPTPTPGQQTTPGISPWWLLAPLPIIAALAAPLIWWVLMRPTPTPAPQPGGEAANTTIQLRDAP